MKPDLARLVRFTIVFALLGLFASVVWPTRWKYDHMTVDGSVVPVRIDRFTGEADMLVPDEGWIPVEAPMDGSTAEPEPQRS